MTKAFRVKTYPEVLANMMARYRAGMGVEADFNIGAVDRTTLEAASLSDADQYIQIGKLLGLFSLDSCKGDDIDRRALELGALFYIPLRRLQARGSTVKVVFGDGTLLARAALTADVQPAATSFVVDDADDFPSSGSIVIERGTTRQERVIYSRTGTTFNVVFPITGTIFPHAAFGEVVRVATQSALASGIIAGATSATILTGNGAAWPVTGTMIFDRGTLSEERRTFTRSGDIFTLGAGTTFGHASGGFVYLSTAGSDRVVSAGTQLFAPATESSRQITFILSASKILFDGDFVSDLADAACTVVGQDTNVGSDVVTKFSSLPFANATVTNPIPAFSGRDREGDDPFKTRLKNFISTVSRGTALAVSTLVLGLQDQTSNSICAFAQIVEPVSPGVSVLYITDGSTSFAMARQTFFGRDVIISDAATGDRRGSLHQSAPYLKQTTPIAQRTPRVFVSVNRGASTSVGANFLEDTTQNMVTNVFANMYLKTADDQFFLIASNTAIRFILVAGGATPVVGAYAILDLTSKVFQSGSSSAVATDSLTDGAATMTVNQYVGYYVLDAGERLYQVASNTATVFTFVFTGTTPTAGAYKVVHSNRSVPLVPGTDFGFNQSNGDVETVDSLLLHDAVVAASDGASPSVGGYTFTTGLGALIQRAVNGDPTDFANFPGIRSTGTQVLLASPTIVSPDILISVLPKPNFSSAEVVAAAKAVIQTYINSLGIGEKVLISKIIQLVMELEGVADVTFISPQGNVYIGDGQMARVDASNVDVAA